MATARTRQLGPLLALLAAACAGAGGLPAGTPLTASPQQSAGSPPPAAATATAPGATAAGTAPATPTAPSTASPVAGEAWRSVVLTDVRSGETLTVEALAGKLVVLEPMAIWCTNCRAQQDQLREALATLDRPHDVVAISLDVDRFEVAADLASYADQREYPWHFAIAGSEASRALAEVFDVNVLSPPTTPKIIVAPDGTAAVHFGYRSADELVLQLRALLP